MSGERGVCKNCGEPIRNLSRIGGARWVHDSTASRIGSDGHVAAPRPISGQASVEDGDA